jgi:hypothetical protein
MRQMLLDIYFTSRDFVCAEGSGGSRDTVEFIGTVGRSSRKQPLTFVLLCKFSQQMTYVN